MPKKNKDTALTPAMQAAVESKKASESEGLALPGNSRRDILAKTLYPVGYPKRGRPNAEMWEWSLAQADELIAIDPLTKDLASAQQTIRELEQKVALQDGLLKSFGSPEDHVGRIQENADLTEKVRALTMVWQPIETAPKDGIALSGYDGIHSTLMFFDDGCDDEGRQVDEPGWYWFDQESVGFFDPTHWQPLPPAPAPDGEAK